MFTRYQNIKFPDCNIKLNAIQSKEFITDIIATNKIMRVHKQIIVMLSSNMIELHVHNPFIIKSRKYSVDDTIKIIDTNGDYISPLSFSLNRNQCIELKKNYKESLNRGRGENSLQFYKRAHTNDVGYIKMNDITLCEFFFHPGGKSAYVGKYGSLIEIARQGERFKNQKISDSCKVTRINRKEFLQSLKNIKADTKSMFVDVAFNARTQKIELKERGENKIKIEIKRLEKILNSMQSDSFDLFYTEPSYLCTSELRFDTACQDNNLAEIYNIDTETNSCYENNI